MIKQNIKQFFHWILCHTIVVFSCILIVVLGIALISYAATTIETNISTDENLTVSGNATITGNFNVSGNTSLATTTISGNLDLGLKQLKNAVLEKLSTFPSSPTQGQMFYSTTFSSPYWYDETNSRWLSPDRESVEAKYVIFHETDGTVYAKNISTGIIDFSGTATSTIINNAINNLTSGRDWKEKVILKGSYNLSSAILLPSYTILEINGKLTAVTNFPTGGMIKNSDQTNGNTDIEVIGGTLDGNYDNQIYWLNCIYIDESSHIKISGVRIKNCRNEGIEFRETSDFIITNNAISDNGDDGISVINNSNNGTISNNRVWSSRNTTGGSSGIELEQGVYEITVTGNVIYTTRVDAMNGIQLPLDSGNGPSHDITIVGNVIRDVTKNGIMPQTQSNGEHVTGIVIADNIISDVGSHGIFAIGSNGGEIRGITISGNTIARTASTTANKYGVYLINVTGAIVSGNNIYESGSYGLRITNASSTIISSNRIYNNGQTDDFYGIRVDGINTAGIIITDNYIGDTQTTKTQMGINVYQSNTDIQIRNNDISDVASNEIVLGSGAVATINGNLGYLTENSGTATITSAAKNVTVSHGLANWGATLSNISVTPQSNLGNASTTGFWISNILGSSFRINVGVAPGADIDFSWQIYRH